MTNRRQLLRGVGVAAIAATIARPASAGDTVQDLLFKLDIALRREVPAIKRVKITYDPKDRCMPLLITAFTI